MSHFTTDVCACLCFCVMARGSPQRIERGSSCSVSDSSVFGCVPVTLFSVCALRAIYNADFFFLFCVFMTLKCFRSSNESDKILTAYHKKI